MPLFRTSLSYGQAFCSHDHICHYLPFTTGFDTYSRSLLKFKKGLRPDMDAWIDCSLEALATDPPPPHTLMIRALHHDETAASSHHPNALDLLGEALATHLRIRYQPSLLRKYRTTRPIGVFNKEDRIAELHDIYYIGDPGNIAPHSILILDDILTTGATIRAILDALFPRFPDCNFRVFTLARAVYDARDLRQQPIRGRTYQLEQGLNWMLADTPGGTQENFP